VEPVVQITQPATNTSIDAGESVTFASDCTDADDVTPLTFAWTFGANSGVSSSIQQNPGAVTFPYGGTFDVTVTCRDALGELHMASRLVTVSGPPMPPPSTPPPPPPSAGGGAVPPGALAILLLVALARRRSR
jgi:PKD repeat protein